MSTISVALSQRLAQAHVDAGQGYVAAPVFGRPDMAAAKLWIATVGVPEQIERCRPLLEAPGQVSIMGEEPWKANLVKLTGNFMIALMNETLGEAFALMCKSGIEPRQFLDVIDPGLFKSPVLSILRYDHRRGTLRTCWI